MTDREREMITDVLMAVTPISKYNTLDDWYKDFKKQMRKRMKNYQKK